MYNPLLLLLLLLIVVHNTKTEINFTNTKLTALAVAGPSVFPTLAIWQNFFVNEKFAREGERGYFKMKFTSPLSFPKGS